MSNGGHDGKWWAMVLTFLFWTGETGFVRVPVCLLGSPVGLVLKSLAGFIVVCWCAGSRSQSLLSGLRSPCCRGGGGLGSGPDDPSRPGRHDRRSALSLFGDLRWHSVFS